MQIEMLDGRRFMATSTRIVQALKDIGVGVDLALSDGKAQKLVDEMIDAGLAR